jgi:hypothetical protein
MNLFFAMECINGEECFNNHGFDCYITHWHSKSKYFFNLTVVLRGEVINEVFKYVRMEFEKSGHFNSSTEEVPAIKIYP